MSPKKARPTFRKGVSDMKDLTFLVSRYGVDVTTIEWLGDDYYYRKLVKTVNEAERFNYRSDYWGDADEYQEDNISLMMDLEQWVGSRCSVDIDGEHIEGTLEGILIDTQYNSISHTEVLFSDVSEGDVVATRRRASKRGSSKKTAKTSGKYDYIGLYRPSDAPDDTIADIMRYWFDCARFYGDEGSCVIGAGFTFKYRGKWYFMRSQSPWQGSISWEHFVGDVQAMLENAGAEDISYDWGVLD